jgi:alpha-L-fucosidase
MGRLKLHEGDVRYTRSKDGRTIYAARLSWPEKPFTLRSFSAGGVGRDVKAASISLLGSTDAVTWARTPDGITITPPAKAPGDEPSWPVIFKIATR